MGQHLQLYASKNITVEQAALWCHWRVQGIIAYPTKEEQAVCDIVDDEMKNVVWRHGDHLEHWASGGGVAAFPFLTDAHFCNGDLIRRAIEAGQVYSKMQQECNPDSAYARHDWARDDAVKFLWDKLDYVIWGYNDGI